MKNLYHFAETEKSQNKRNELSDLAMMWPLAHKKFELEAKYSNFK